MVLVRASRELFGYCKGTVAVGCAVFLAKHYLAVRVREFVR